eukprot:1160997-Pelagomonas_calceolata.AAC.12
MSHRPLTQLGRAPIVKVDLAAGHAVRACKRAVHKDRHLCCALRQLQDCAQGSPSLHPACLVALLVPLACPPLQVQSPCTVTLLASSRITLLACKAQIAQDVQLMRHTSKRTKTCSPCAHPSRQHLEARQHYVSSDKHRVVS